MGYTVGKDFNTKDWFVYCDETNTKLWFETEGQATKYAWVKGWLAPFFRNVPRSSITDIEYKVEYEGFREVLIITYEGGGTKQCNVSCDSPLAMVEDMYRQCAVY